MDKDLDIKSKIYAEAGIPEYWVVDLRNRQLIVFRDLQYGEYRSKSTLTGGTIYPLAFPDLPVSISEIISNA
ncbi:Uma2 family endonuclease [Pseudanabaena sp. PCC 6802]|uniref:Uma2 family endonuclease n=1 Tax=Pseudanabaena sp. PCC 6802 TaxID=118173 RepID=UPI00034832C1|nr:Uma2 family endonuclease [Pseudanabaena sp. PCC 6802]